MNRNRIKALLLCIMLLVTSLPMTALAAPATVTIESQTNSSFDYLEYYKDGDWNDLNTPKHWIEQTGEIVYCVEHAAETPHGDTYVATSPDSVFSASTLSGLNSILMYGYPNNTPAGFTADEARQATANALRFWLSEQGEAESYDFTNRSENPDRIRAKSGYEHVLEWADELLNKARARLEMPHAVTMNPSPITMKSTGSDGFSGQVKVSLTNINSGYTLDTSSLPAGSKVSGFTGNRSETLTITLPSSAEGKSYKLPVTGSDTRSVDNITAYVPSDGSLQKTFLCATTKQVVVETELAITVEEYARLRIQKTDENNVPLGGVTFSIYADEALTQKLATGTTDNAEGAAIFNTLPGGTLYLTEDSAPDRFILMNPRKVWMTAGRYSILQLMNEPAKGVIRVEKTGDVLTSRGTKKTDYGEVALPTYEVQGLAGAKFEVRDSSNTVVATLTTDKDGKAESEQLPLGTYTVQETKAPTGYVKDATVHTVTMAHKDQHTPIIYGDVEAENTVQTGSVKIRKMTERFNANEIDFYNALAEGYVFGLYTGQDIGDFPKDSLLEILTTDASGVAQSSVKYPYGKYYLRELYVPDENVILSAEKYELTISSEMNTQHFDSPIYNTQHKAKIGVYKLDADDKERGLEGAIFEVKDEDGKLLDTITTNANGYAESVDLPIGTYKVQETKAPAGFLKQDTVKTVTLTTDDKTTAVFEQTNEATEVMLTKTDAMTQTPVGGATIEIYDASNKLVHSSKTAEDGTLTVRELPIGTYTFRETDTTGGYALNSTNQSFTIHEDGSVTGTTAFTNEPTKLVITKMDTYTGKAFAGIEFTLKNSAGEIVKTTASADGYRVPAIEGNETFTVDENGQAIFLYLPIGTYSLEESVPSGYIGEENPSFQLTGDHGVSTPLQLTVNNCPTGIKILKTDAANDKPLKGAGFRIKVKNQLGFDTLKFAKQSDGSYFCDANGTEQDLMVNDNGEVMIFGVPLGAIWIEESIVPEGYFPVAARKAEITAEAKATAPMEINIQNSRSVKLGLDNDWWEIPAIVLSILLAAGGAGWYVLVYRKKQQKIKKRVK